MSLMQISIVNLKLLLYNKTITCTLFNFWLISWSVLALQLFQTSLIVANEVFARVEVGNCDIDFFIFHHCFCIKSQKFPKSKILLKNFENSKVKAQIYTIELNWTQRFCQIFHQTDLKLLLNNSSIWMVGRKKGCLSIN